MNKYFGTDGIRATFENSFLDEDFAFSLGKALALFIQKNENLKHQIFSDSLGNILDYIIYNDTIVDFVQKYFPNVSTETYTPWAGLRPMTPNMMPITSESKMKGIFYHAGHGHLGWTLSAQTAQIVADKVEEKN